MKKKVELRVIHFLPEIFEVGPLEEKKIRETLSPRTYPDPHIHLSPGHKN